MGGSQLKYVVDGFPSKVGGNLDKQRHIGVHLAEGLQDFIQRALVLQLAKVGRVGGADVDDKEICQAL